MIERHRMPHLMILNIEGNKNLVAGSLLGEIFPGGKTLDIRLYTPVTWVLYVVSSEVFVTEGSFVSFFLTDFILASILNVLFLCLSGFSVFFSVFLSLSFFPCLSCHVSLFFSVLLSSFLLQSFFHNLSFCLVFLSISFLLSNFFFCLTFFLCFSFFHCLFFLFFLSFSLSFTIERFLKLPNLPMLF